MNLLLVQESELRRLERTAAEADAERRRKAGVASVSAADEEGNRPALRRRAGVSIARSIVQERRAAGLTQEELARLAGVRQQTICRLESGNYSSTVRTIAKIDRASCKPR